MAAYFSEDILTEILKRLPVPSLIKLMLVHKSWYRLIQSPYFNKALYSHHQKNTNYILFHCNEHCISLRVNDKQCNQYPSLPFPEDIKVDASTATMTIPGISNGLICVCYYMRITKSLQIYLWNPIIQKYKTLPHSLLDDDPTCQRFLKGLVFGYVPKINDYKLIEIVKYRDEEGKHLSDKVGLLVYSLSTNSWKTVSKDNFAKSHYFRDPVIVNGTAYWVGKTRAGSLIVCFDMENEIIREIMLPPPYFSKDSVIKNTR